MSEKQVDRMSDFSFKMMAASMQVMDLVWPRVERRARQFGLQPGMQVVDYGCGPGRYTVQFARLVGPSGKVYAVDIQELALDMVRRKMARQGLENITPVLAHGYACGLPDGCADMTLALDMFFGVSHPTALLAELKRITRKDGLLVLDDGHQSRQATLAKIQAAGGWKIVEQNRDHLKLKPAAG